MLDFQHVEKALSAFGRGELLVVVDDDDRENEADLIGAAALLTPQQMAFMIRHTSGIICAPMLPDDARRLQLSPMVAVNDAPMGTAFTVSVDYREGLTTGISAEERTACVHALANGNVVASDFVRPGHIFPLIANQGGVLLRSGHTEAGVDLCRLSGCAPVGVLAELMNDDGTVKRGAEVEAFAREHGLLVISVADLIAYRQDRERLVERMEEVVVRMPMGVGRGIFYRTPFDDVHHLAVVFGDVAGEDIPVRFHRENVLEDVFGDRDGIRAVYETFEREGRGVLVYLRDGAVGVRAPGRGGASEDRKGNWREVGLGSQILKDLGVRSFALLSDSDRHYVGVGGFGLRMTRTVPLEGKPVD